MNRRIRPITYAEALEAKKYSEENNQNTIDKESKKEEINQIVTSLNTFKISNLPSKGQSYPKNAEIYYTPFSFGEMKFLSGSSLSDVESINFFLNKIQCSFPKEDLTYYDFYFLTVMIKMSTFGEINYNMTFECNKCGHINTIPFSIEDLDFNEIRVPMPISIDLKQPYKDTETDTELSKITFVPISIGRYKKMIEEDVVDDFDIYMANCIKDGKFKERLTLIKDYLNGSDISLLETIDVSLYHGVKDIPMACENKILPEGKSDGDEEVCGREFDIPFHDLAEYISATDELKKSLGQRIHFGV